VPQVTSSGEGSLQVKAKGAINFYTLDHQAGVRLQALQHYASANIALMLFELDEPEAL